MIETPPLILLYTGLVLVKRRFDDFMLQADKNPQIDEAVWQAWLESNKAQDKFKFARRLKIIALVMVFLAVGALLWRFTG